MCEGDEDLAVVEWQWEVCVCEGDEDLAVVECLFEGGEDLAVMECAFEGDEDYSEWQWMCSFEWVVNVADLECTDVSGAELVQERSEEVRRYGKKWRVCPEVEKV